MRLLCVAPYVPYVGIPHAGGAYLGRYLDVLARSEDVTLLAPATSDNRTAAAQATNYEVVLAEPPRLAAQRMRVRANNARLALGPGWLTHLAIRDCPSLPELVTRSDVIDIEFGQLLTVVPRLRELKAGALVATEHDVVAQSMSRRADNAAVWRRAAIRLQAARVMRREASLLNRTDLVRTLCEKDRQLLSANGVQTPIIVTELLGGGSSQSATSAGRPGPVLFTGALWRIENIWSLRWFIEKVWPMVRSAKPDAEFVAVGARPAEETLTYSGHAGVTIKGWVDDLDAEYARAGVFVAPLVAGAGIKVKVLEAMRSGLPVVTTTIGAEGIAETAPGDAFGAITDDATNFAAAVVSLLNDRPLRRQVGAKAAGWSAARPTFTESVAASLAVYQQLHERSDT